MNSIHSKNIDLNDEDINGWTQLIQNIDLNGKDTCGWTLFINTCKNGHTNVVKWDISGDFQTLCT